MLPWNFKYTPTFVAGKHPVINKKDLGRGKALFVDGMTLPELACQENITPHTLRRIEDAAYMRGIHLEVIL